jgi:hypothetical protein
VEGQNSTRTYGKLRNNSADISKQHNKTNESSTKKQDKGIISRGSGSQATQVHIYTSVHQDLERVAYPERVAYLTQLGEGKT